MWRVWLIVALVTVVACRESANQQIDARQDARSCSPRPGYPECGLDFSLTCGNGVVDNCIQTVPSNDGAPMCPTYRPMTEECDGSAGPSCSNIGYFGGAAACTSHCHFDPRGCSACGVADCVTSQEAVQVGLATNSGHIAIAYEQAAEVTIFDDAAPGLEPLVTTMYADPIEAIVGVPNGWLVATSGSIDIHALANDGTHVGDSAAGLGEKPMMVYGPGGHAVLVGQEIVNSHPDLWAAVIDANANTIVAPFVLAPPSDDNLTPSLTTDGTSFFVGTRGQVTRLDANGAVVSMTTGFPTSQSQVTALSISWSGTTGWYVLEDLNQGTTTAQAFDATGAPLGLPISNLGSFMTVPVADGTGLLAITPTTLTPRLHLNLVSLDATGAVVSTTELGATDQDVDVRLGRFDATHVAITWQGAGKRELALVSEP